MKSVGNSNLIRFIRTALKNKMGNLLVIILTITITLLSLLLPQITKGIIDDGIMSKNIRFLLQMAAIYLIINILNTVCRIALDLTYSRLNKQIISRLKIRIVSHLSKLSGRYFTNIKTGELMNVIDSDTYIIENSGIQLFFDMAANSITAIIAFAFLARMQFDLLLIVIIIQAVMILSQFFFSKAITRQVQSVREQTGTLGGILQEYIANLVYIVIVKAKLFIFRKYFRELRKYAHKSIKLDLTFSSNVAVSVLLNNLITVCIYGYGGYKVITDQLTFGELIAFQQYAGLFIGPLMIVIRSSSRVQQVLVSIDRVFSILYEPIEIKQNNRGDRPGPAFTGCLEFEDVTFSYDEQQVLKLINMTFEPGTITGIAGGSGSGKTTITKLIYRLWDVDSGRILVDGIDIREYNLMALRKRIAIISQDVFLFNDTILNNLSMGNSSVELERIEYICKKIGIYGFIMEQPDGFQTVVGEKGIKLSGGQKQKLAFVRMLLSDSEIIVLDEASSALDNNSEKIIWDNMRDLTVNKTVIVIAHRLSTIQDADNIYILNNGQVSEKGNHERLLNLKGQYYDLWNVHNVAL